MPLKKGYPLTPVRSCHAVVLHAPTHIRALHILNHFHHVHLNGVLALGVLLANIGDGKTWI
jgi:hypothetical protein